MSKQERHKYWIELAEYDLETAKVILTGERYLYIGFMCHQVIEKALKGYYACVSGDNPPYIHNLTILSKKSGIYQLFTEEQKDIIDSLEPLNIQARYPTTKDKLMKSLTKEKCKKIIDETEALFQWIKARL
ncbi:MAG: HEPN domain-containing protein [Clostridia bacterium]|jgi:HEPN domain-containing protein|nr:HEPN domain-containing protein [Clostridiales bacterium]